MKVFIGADHRGFELKNYIVDHLTKKGYEVIDCGNHQLDPDDDYPDYAFSVADSVIAHPGSRGILICGSSVGVSMAANKVKGIRCGAASTLEEVKIAREHDDISILALGANRIQKSTDVQELIITFLETPFSDKICYIRRLNKITKREEGLTE